MTEACGVRYEDAAGGIETEEIDGVHIPFAGAKLLLKMKQSSSPSSPASGEQADPLSFPSAVGVRNRA